MNVAIFADERDLLGAPIAPLVANHDIERTWRVGDGAQVLVLPGSSGCQEQLVQMSIAANVDKLLGAALSPFVAHHRIATWQRCVGDSTQINMAPWPALFSRQLMQMGIITNEDNLFGAPCCPAIPGRDLDGRRRSGNGAQIRVLPDATGGNPQLMNMSVGAQIGYLLGASCGKRVANEEAAGCQRGAGQGGQISMLPRSAVANVKLVNMAVLADIGNLFGVALRPIKSNQWFHANLLQ